MIELLDLEQHGLIGTLGFSTRRKREQLAVKMLARVIFVEGTRRERGWVRIMGVTTVDGKATAYTGELVDDLNIDLDRGAAVSFGPEHVLEWDVEPLKSRRRAT